MKRKLRGKVYLVGAGPGDPGLITRRGADLLTQADVVVVDALVSPLLASFYSKAEKYFVGKRGPGAPGGSSLRLSQKGINKLLIRLARQGQRVVRLKGGDPFIFGRGSEELEALHAAKIPYEIVPGVTSAIGAPAYAGIPITDRRWASQVTIVTGQGGRDDQALGPGVDWERLSPKGTTVFLMAVSQWPFIRENLLSRDWSMNVPVVAIESGTTANQRVIETTLSRSYADFYRYKLAAPAVIVAGPVAQLSSKLSWVKKEKPLLGRTVVVTRAEEQNQTLVRMLEDKGAVVLSAPVLRVVPTSHPLPSESSFDWIVFLSANGVKTFYEKGARFRRAKICAVGPKTRDTVLAYGGRVQRMASAYNAAGVVRALGVVRGKKILIPRVQGGPRDIVRALTKRGAHVTEWEIYRTERLRLSLETKKQILSGVAAVTFTSGSTVRNFLSNFTPPEIKRIFSNALCLSIGPITSKEIRRYHLPKICQSKHATVESMVEYLIKGMK